MILGEHINYDVPSLLQEKIEEVAKILKEMGIQDFYDKY